LAPPSIQLFADHQKTLAMMLAIITKSIVERLPRAKPTAAEGSSLLEREAMFATKSATDGVIRITTTNANAVASPKQAPVMKLNFVAAN
jgi:hypothetical protein